MIKKITFLLTLIPSVLFSQINDPAPYCSIDYWGAHYNMINTLNIDGTTHSFGTMGNFATTIPFVYQNSLLFSDFDRGSTKNFTIDFYSIDDGEPQYFGVFVDFNQNDIFEDNELIMHNGNTLNAALPAFGQPAVTVSLDVVIPSDALLGVTRMRVIRGEDLTPDEYDYDPNFGIVPCYDFQASYGCYFDFDVNITQGATGIVGFDQKDLLCYPNPSNGVVYFGDNVIGVELYSMDGRKIISEFDQAKIDLSGFVTGMYILVLTDKRGMISVEKIQLK